MHTFVPTDTPVRFFFFFLQITVQQYRVKCWQNESIFLRLQWQCTQALGPSALHKYYADARKIKFSGIYHSAENKNYAPGGHPQAHVYFVAPILGVWQLMCHVMHMCCMYPLAFHFFFFRLCRWLVVAGI